MAHRVQWVLAALLLAATSLSAQDDPYRYARVRYAEPSAVLQRAAEAEAEEASANVPFVPGDRLWTDGTGRAEFQFFNGSLAWLDSGSKLDYSAQEGGDRAVLRLWSGSLALRLRSRDGFGFVVETPSVVVDVVNGAVLRVDVGPDSTRVSVREGTAVVEANGQSLRVAEGERTEVQRDGALEEVWRFGSGDDDQFDDWVDARDRGSAWASTSSRYLPEDLRAYASDFDSNGAWYHESDAGYVWRPYVDEDWSPYWNGRWAWSAYGWTWVPDESWGWAPSHYGRWGFSVSLGWYWIPDCHWGPAWVSWAIGTHQVGWCALDRWNRPLRHHGRGGRDGHFVGRGTGHGEPWLFVNRSDFGRHGVAHRRIAGMSSSDRGLRTFDSSTFRPGRGLSDAVSAKAAPRIASERARASAPWSHRIGGRSDGALSGAERRAPRPMVLDRGASSGTRTERSNPWFERRRTAPRRDADTSTRDAGVSGPADRWSTERRGSWRPSFERRSESQPDAPVRLRERETSRPSAPDTRARERDGSVFGRLFRSLGDRNGEARGDRGDRGDSGNRGSSARQGGDSGSSGHWGGGSSHEGRGSSSQPSSSGSRGGHSGGGGGGAHQRHP